MKKIIIITILLILVIPIRILALEYPTLHYKNAIIYNITDQETLYTYNADEKRAIASLTKLMTILTAIEKSPNKSDSIIYTEKMASKVPSGVSLANLKVNSEYTFEDYLYGAMLPSGADATIALAYITSGSIEDFVDEMNNLAKKIGLKNTNYMNVHGLDEENHYSTAEDIKTLLEYALKNETFKKVYTTKEHKMKTGQIIYSTVKKQSANLKIDTSQIIGSKTGFTLNAGLCISLLMEDEGHEILIITLGAPTNQGTPYNVTDAIELIKYTKDNNNYQVIFPKYSFTKNIKVNLSTIDSYKISSTKEISMYLPNDYDKKLSKIEYNGATTLSYKDQKNTKIGEIKYYYNDKLIDSENIFLNKEINISYKKLLLKNKDKIIIAIISILVIILVPIILLLIKTKPRKSN